MKSFKDTVREVSNRFLTEAKQSPQLIADMAKMEYYMAESYSGRLFIELLQNADDAKSTRIISYYNHGNLYFANNGKPFDENDLVAISRSGASDKQRGKTIGYRGIGFKSASAVSNDIIIYSANTYFSFSKEKCSKLLNMKMEEIPTIRIPIYIEQIEQEVQADIELLKDNGYSTVFVFKNVDIELYLEDLKDVNDGYFIFLNNVYDCVFDIGQYQDHYEISRFTDFGNDHTEIKSTYGLTEWMIVKNRNAAIAFLIEDGKIVPCEDNKAVYHCYLPTLEKSLISCKINADFSTDPSRKHITMDEITKSSLNLIAQIFCSVFEMALNEADTGKYKNFFNMYLNKTVISKMNYYLNEIIEKELLSKKWIKLGNGTKISPTEYKMLPASFDVEKPEMLRAVPGEISQESLSKDVYENIDGVESFMGRFSRSRMELSTISHDLSSTEYVKQLNPETHTQLLTSVIRESKVEAALNSDYSPSIGNYVVKTENDEYLSINEALSEEEELDSSLKQELTDRLGTSEISWVQEQVGSPDLIKKVTPEIAAPFVQGEKKNSKTELTPHIAKWRSAENKCVAIEESLGNEAFDVSLKNYGYDVESVTPDGKHRYIEVKSVKKDYSFSLTNNEYTAAHQYGEDYYICLLLEDEDKLIVRYIQDPLNNAKFEKRIKQWEWICLESTSSLMTFDYES